MGNKSINQKKEVIKSSIKLKKTIDKRKGSSKDIELFKKDYSLLFNNMLNGFALCKIIFDKEGKVRDYRFLEVNPPFEKLAGLKRINIIGKTSMELLPGLQPRWNDTYEKVAITGKPVRFEHYSQPLGKYYDVNTYSPQKGYFITIFSELESESLIFEKFFKKYLEYVGLMFLMLDKKGHVSFINKKGVELLGYPEREIIGKDWFINFLPIKIRSETKKYFMKILRGELPIDSCYETPVITKSGVKTLQWQNTLLKDVDGEIFGILLSAEDTTERKQVEDDALQDSKKKLLRALSISRIGFLTWDLKTNKIFLSDEAYHIYGLERQDDFITPDMVVRIVHPDDIGYFNEMLEQIIKGAKEYDTGYRVVWPDGAIHYVHVQTQLTYDLGGTPDKLLGTVIDVTERKRLEKDLEYSNKQLLESAQKWNATFDAIRDGIFMIDVEQNILQCNKAFADLLGKTFSEIIGKKCYRLMHSSAFSLENCPFLKVRQSKQRESMKFWFKDTLFNVLVDPIFDKNSNLTGAVDIFTDITERERMEEALRQSEEKYRLIIENTLQGFLVIQDFGIVFANTAAAKISGYTVKELLSLSPEGVKSLVHPEDQGLVWKRFRDRLEWKPKLMPQHHEYRGIRKDGSVYWLEMFATRIEYRGKPVIQAAIIDITERKHSEEALKNSNEHLKKIYNSQNLVRKLNQFLLKCDNEVEIYEKVCDFFMESDLIKFIWIGLIEEGNFDVKPVAYKGSEKGYIHSLVKWDNSPYGNGPTGIAIKTKKPVVICNVRTDPRYMPWRKEVLKRSYLSMIALPLIYEGKVLGVLDVYSEKKDAFIEEDVELLKEVGNDIAIGIKSVRLTKNLQERSKQLEESIANIIFTMTKISESKDPYTAGHQRRVNQLATAIARKMRLSEDRIEAIRFASLIHDIGKIAIPGEILSKPSKLTEIEFALIKEHPKICHDIIKDINFPWDIASIILQHHERLDGSGYPEGLKDKEILLEAKILAVADVVEAMSSHRPYRPALGIDKALEEISINKGKLFEPKVVDACIKVFKKDGFKFKQ
jgi:PAS domain S-box-containing protein